MKLSNAILVCGLLVAGQAGAGDVNPSGRDAAPSKAEVRQLLAAMHTDAQMRQMLDMVIQQFSRLMPQVPPAQWAELKKEMVTDDLIDAVVELYEKHFTAEEVRGLIAFYESSLGKRLIEEQPQIMAESMAVGQEWGRRAGQRLEQKLKAKGYKMPSGA